MSRDPAGPPDDLSAAFKAVYRTVRKALEAQGTWQDVDGELLGLYVRCLERAWLARASTVIDGVVQLTTAGSRGPISNPALRIARDAERDAEDYAKELLLTPRARAQFALEAKRQGGKFGKALGG